MKKYLACFLILAVSLFTLCSCASEDTTAAPTPSEDTSQVETETVPPEESEVPSVDTEAPVEEEESEEAKGIIALSADTTTSGAHWTILSIDPNTGDQQVVSTFNISREQQRNYAVSGTAVYHYANFSSVFSPDFSKMAAIYKNSENGEIHAGWFDETGKFFDVTVALGLQSKSDFDDPVSHETAGFSKEGIFILYDGENYHYYSPDKSGAVEASEVALAHWYEICGTIDDPLRNRSSERTTDWIDDTHILADTTSEAIHGFSNSSGGRYMNSAIIDLSTGEETYYIPGESRWNWGGVLSPDGNSIAFVSRARSDAMFCEVGLYTVPFSGGDPQKVELPSDVLSIGSNYSDNTSHYCTLLDWR